MAIFCWVTAATAQESQTLVPIKDNTLIEDVTGSLSNGKSSLFFVGRTNQPQDSIRRGIIAFDIAKMIPNGSKITSVTLTLTLEKTPGVHKSKVRSQKSKVLPLPKEKRIQEMIVFYLFSS